jgi:hypothetical protein
VAGAAEASAGALAAALGAADVVDAAEATGSADPAGELAVLHATTVSPIRISGSAR